MTKYFSKDGVAFDSEEDAWEHDCWLDEIAQQSRDEGRWEDNGCQWPAPY